MPETPHPNAACTNCSSTFFMHIGDNKMCPDGHNDTVFELAKGGPPQPKNPLICSVCNGDVTAENLTWHLEDKCRPVQSEEFDAGLNNDEERVQVLTNLMSIGSFLADNSDVPLPAPLLTGVGATWGIHVNTSEEFIHLWEKFNKPGWRYVHEKYLGIYKQFGLLSLCVMLPLETAEKEEIIF